MTDTIEVDAHLKLERHDTGVCLRHHIPDEDFVGGVAWGPQYSQEGVIQILLFEILKELRAMRVDRDAEIPF